MGDIKGYIYILTNRSFPEYVKIGYANDVEARVKILNNKSSVPFSFRIYATYAVPMELSDKKIHFIIDSLNAELRAVEIVNGQKRKREFYEIPPEVIYNILLAMAEIHGVSDRIKKYEIDSDDMANEQEALLVESRNNARIANFRFFMARVPMGAEIVLVDDINIKAKVIAEDRVSYNGKKYSLSGLACEILHKDTIRGPEHFMYNGELLTDLRARYEFLDE